MLHCRLTERWVELSAGGDFVQMQTIFFVMKTMGMELFIF